jgi:cellulose synthase/poly-beta-1,6-N-acetylglucosamine synthase-like glycosyltransferase
MKIAWTILFLALSVDSFLRFVLLLVRWVARERRSLTTSEGVGPATLLISARDEAGTIGRTVKLLVPLLAEWPGSRVAVIADNCSDDTASEARSAGASVAQRRGGRLGKGAAIEWWISTERNSSGDREVIVILDADSRLKPGSLSAVRREFEAGATVVQGFVAPEAGEHTASRLAGYSEVLMQRIDDEARRRLGWSVPLRGTAMAFRVEVLATLTPLLHTLAEDLELDVLLASRHISVHFAPDGVVIDPKPPASSGVSNQRARWFQGQLQVLRDYPGQIVRSLLSGGLGVWLLLPLLFLRPKLLLVLIRILALIVGVSVGAPWWIVAAALVADALYYLCGASIMDRPSRYLLDLLSVPRYALLWVYSLGLAVVRRGGWLRAGR